MSFKDELRSYIQTKLHSILEDMVTNILVDQPKVPEIYALEYLISQFGNGLSDSENRELIDLREEYARLNVDKNREIQIKLITETLSESESETDDSEDDYVDELPTSTKKMQMRSSVSAEAFGN